MIFGPKLSVLTYLARFLYFLYTNVLLDILYQANVEWMDVANFHWKWIVQSDVTGRTSRPVMSSYYDDKGYLDDDEQYAKVQDIDWQTQSFNFDLSEELKWYSDMWKEKGDWFRVPPICQ